MATVETQRRRLTADERDALLARVHDGASYRSIAAEFGVSRERVRKLANDERKARRREAEEELARDPDLAALRLRWETSLGLVDAVDVPERWELLAAVVFPSDELLEVSRARALVGVEETDPRRLCGGCGGEPDGVTLGCRTCQDRKDGRAKRARQCAAAAGVSA
jgi:hypothetical protein